MKAIEQSNLKAVLKLASLAVLFLAFSCSPETVNETEKNLEAAYAKSTNSIVKTLVKGAAISGANGIDIGSDGNLYIASVNDLEIIVLNKNNGKIIERIGQEKGVRGPDDLIFGPDGSLYWTNLLVGTVGRLEPDGTVTEQFVALGVNPITFSDDGRLFVALDFLGDGLYELDPNLTNPPRHIIESTEANPFPLGFLNSFDFGDDGFLYGPLFAAGMVIKVNVDPPVALPSSNPFGDGIAEVVATGFGVPAAAKFSPDGILHVLDQTGEVFQVNTETGEKTLFTVLQPGLDNLVFDEDGTLYITNADEGWVVEILPSGKARTISPGGIIAPAGLAVLEGANNHDALFEADLFQLRQFNGSSGQLENKYKGNLVPVPGETSLILPMNISADGDNLIISSWFSGRVQVFNPQTGNIEDVPLSPPGVPTVPIDALRFKGDIVVSDLGLGGVVLASTLAPILPIDGVSVFAPGGLATDGETVWAADWGSGLIWQIDFDGTTPNTPFPVDVRPMVNPEGLALDNEGRLLVVEAGASRLSRIDLSTGEVSVIAEGLEIGLPGLPGYPPTWAFDGVAVGLSGDIYVSGNTANLIYRITQNKVR